MVEKYFRSSTFRFAMASFIAAVMLLFRYYKVGRDTYIFLLWNLFLAWIPYILVLVLAFVLSYPSKPKRYLSYVPFLKTLCSMATAGFKFILFFTQFFLYFYRLNPLNFQRPKLVR